MPSPFLDRLRNALPYRYLLPLAVVMALAPFRPQPHLIEKIAMLFHGTLKQPVDIFDLALHGSPLALLLVRLGIDVSRKWRRPTSGTASSDSGRNKR